MTNILDFVYPMKFIRPAFVDALTGRPVNYYKTRSGKIVMAEHRRAFFRVLSEIDHDL